jgi:nucleotide-binding universal stress UspA family protein
LESWQWEGLSYSFKTILVATDFSDAASEAVKYGRALAVVSVSRFEARASE